jgi:hypothetical protein
MATELDRKLEALVQSYANWGCEIDAAKMARARAVLAVKVKDMTQRARRTNGDAFKP